MTWRLKFLALLLLCQFGSLIATLRAVIDIIRGKRGKAWEILIAYDRLANAGTYGESNEMLTYRAARGRREGVRGWCLLCYLLDKIDPGHCDRARP